MKIKLLKINQQENKEESHKKEITLEQLSCLMSHKKMNMITSRKWHNLTHKEEVDKMIPKALSMKALSYKS
jgi:hypothetical protein